MKSVEKYLLDKIREFGNIHISLIDPEEIKQSETAFLSKSLEKAGTDAIMVGGSTVVSLSQLDETVQNIKANVNIPVILFPNNLTGVSQYADALWFMSLLNSTNPYFITGIQALAAPLIKRMKIESIPLGYIIVGEGSTAAYVGQAHVIPHDKPEVATGFALAAQYMGMRFVYLEAGSGSESFISPKMISLVKKYVEIPIIVGGGIRTPQDAKLVAEAGADIIVTGTIIEESSNKTLQEIILSIKEAGKNKILNPSPFG